MSFSSETKIQLAKMMSHNPCCQRAEFLALVKSDGTIRIGGGSVSLVITTENTAVAGKIYRLSKELFAIPGEVTTYRKLRLKKNNVYEVVIPAQPELEKLFGYMGLDESATVWTSDFRDIFPWALVEKECCKRAYLRGAFLGSGSVNRPDGPYHMEITCERKSQAEALQRIMAALDLHARISERKAQFVLYLKDGNQIVDFLNHVGAHKSLLAFEDERIKKEIYNNINRRNNFDMANVDKTIKTSMQQCAAIEKLEATTGIDHLPAGLQQVARLRIENPEQSLAELAALTSPPLSKSGVSRRLQKIVEIADKLQVGK